MKNNKLLISALMLAISVALNAQNYGTFNAELPQFTGRVGIGTSGPEAKFQVNPGGLLGGALIKAENSMGMSGVVTTPYALRVVYDNTAYSPVSTDNVLEVSPLGKVYAGQIVTNASYTNNNDYLNVDKSIGVYSNASNNMRLGLNLDAAPGVTSEYSGIVWEGTGTGTASLFQISSSFSQAGISLSPSGNVGIATTDIDGTHKLYVGGSMITEEVRVMLLADWPDYVFAEGYELMSLDETSEFIKRNHHLPGVPSAETVAKDGIDLGAMEATLLQKIEELTLHLIKQQELIEELKEEVDALKNQ